MKKQLNLLLSFMLILLVSLGACTPEKDVPEVYPTYQVNVQLTYPEGVASVAGIPVSLVSTNAGTTFEAKTNSAGIATFNVIAGVYTATATDSRKDGYTVALYNGSQAEISVTADITAPVRLSMGESKTSALVVKELYIGGFTLESGKTFAYDSYISLHNNSAYEVSLQDVVLAIAFPYNSSGNNHKDYVDGVNTLEGKGYLPAAMGIWYFTSDARLAAGQQAIIALKNAINLTETYPQSINFDNPSYYCTYDPEVWTHKLTYVQPAASIPTSHYLKAKRFGLGTAWVLSQFSPGFFIFSRTNLDIDALVTNTADMDMTHGTNFPRLKIADERVIDAVEVFSTKYPTENHKRITTKHDAGQVWMTAAQGYSLYRNVDKEATLALPENAGKIIYNYSLGVDDSTDPSGIDAEASIKNGARIIYQDTNNSTNDFHQRRTAALRK